MKITKVNVEVSYLKALPNYENVRITAGAEVMVEEGENYKEVYESAWKIAGNEVGEQLKLFSKQGK